MSEPRGSRYQNQQGTVEVSNSSASGELIAAVSGKKVYCTRAFVNITTAATSGGGLFKLLDGAGGSTILELDANSIASHQFDFGDTGYELGSGNILQAGVIGAGGNQATVSVTALGYHR